MSIVGLSGCSAIGKSRETIKKSELVEFGVDSSGESSLFFCELNVKTNWNCPSVTTKTVSVSVVEKVVEDESASVAVVKVDRHLDNILFEFDSSRLTEASKVKLISYFPILLNGNIELSGYTDDVGSDEYNKKLAFDRAYSVKEFLVRMGTSHPINIVGMGKCCFLESNNSDESRALNRRVEIYLKEQAERN